MIETQLSSGESVVCTLWGDLDWVGATPLRHVMADALQPGMEVVIDLRHVDFFDAVGISALVGFSRRARSMGSRVRILNATPDLCRRLERFGLRWVLDSSVGDDNDAA